jgi:hypothetical protein
MARVIFYAVNMASVSSFTPRKDLERSDYPNFHLIPEDVDSMWLGLK